MRGMLARWFQNIGTDDAAAWATVTYVGLRILLIVLIAWIALGVARRAIRLFRSRRIARGADAEQIKRIETLARVFRYIASVIVFIVAGMLILTELGVSIAPVLATAGVAGIAVGFGAQSLIKDYFTGFFLLLENQIRQGDVVEVAGLGGLVEEMTLRYVRLRDWDGNVHYVPNGTISTVTNRSCGFAYAVIDVGVDYREDIDRVMAVMQDVARELRADAAFATRILDDLEMAGIERFADSSVMLRCRFRVQALEQWSVRREYFRRLKKRFDEVNIDIPYPHLVLYRSDDEKFRSVENPARNAPQA